MSDRRPKQRRVVCAANISPDGYIILGARHWDGLMNSHKKRLGLSDCHDFKQGFIDQHGVWMDRREAWAVAEAAGQIIHGDWGDGVLYSENLY